MRHNLHFPLLALLLQAVPFIAPAQTLTTPWTESFEAWPGVSDYYWLPDGWSLQCSDESLKAQNRTWFLNLQTSAYAPAPTDGSVYAEILAGGTSTTQDEWLLTPTFTPQAGDVLSYYVILTPFNLFDFAYYDYSAREFTERHLTWDLYTLLSIDGGEWQAVDSISRYWIDVDGWTLRQSAGYGCEQQRVLYDLAAYVGHTVRVAFRYVGHDGDTMFLDLVSVGTPTVQASYLPPYCTLWYGLAPDYSNPAAGRLYMPSGCDLTWANTSSAECTDFVWQYTDGTGAATSADRHLTVSFPEASSTDPAQVYDLPVLTSRFADIAQGTYQMPNLTMQVAGNSQFSIPNSQFQAGFANYDPLHGRIALLADSGEPIFGVINGQNTYWQGLYTEAGITDYEGITITALYNGFNAPLQPYALRGCWVQGVGQIPATATLTLTVHRLTDAGAIDQTPLATATLRGSDVGQYGPDSIFNSESSILNCQRLTLPFTFDEPLYVDELLFLRLSGLDTPGLTFVPYQSYEPERECHGYVRVGYQVVGNTGTQYTMWPISNAETAEYGTCNNAFYFTLDMNYVSRAEYEAATQEPVVPEVPIDEAPENYMLLNNTTSYPLRAAFYDATTTPDSLRLYLCAGQVEYGEAVTSTFHIALTLATAQVGDTLTLGTDASAYYYSIDPIGVQYVAAEGRVVVDETADRQYRVWLMARDGASREPFSALYTRTNWADFTQEPPHPSYWTIVSAGDTIALRSCVVDFSHADSALYYLSSQPNVTTVAQMEALAPEPIVLLLPQTCTDGRIWGFSALSNNNMIHGITLQGQTYTYASAQTDDIVGGNITVTLDSHLIADHAASPTYVAIDFTLYGVSAFSSSVKGHYDGVFTWSDDPSAAAITEVRADGGPRPLRYDLLGRPVSGAQRGVIFLR